MILGRTSKWDNQTGISPQDRAEETKSSNSHEVIRGPQPTYFFCLDSLQPAALAFLLRTFTENSNGISSCAAACAWRNEWRRKLQETWFPRRLDLAAETPIQHTRCDRLGVGGRLHCGKECESQRMLCPRRVNGHFKISRAQKS